MASLQNGTTACLWPPRASHGGVYYNHRGLHYPRESTDAAQCVRYKTDTKLCKKEERKGGEERKGKKKQNLHDVELLTDWKSRKTRFQILEYSARTRIESWIYVAFIHRRSQVFVLAHARPMERDLAWTRIGHEYSWYEKYARAIPGDTIKSVLARARAKISLRSCSRKLPLVRYTSCQLKFCRIFAKC